MKQEDLAVRISEYRLRNGMRQQDLADNAGLDRTAVAKIENGTRRVSALELDAIARALDVGVDWFFQPAPSALVSYRNALDPDVPTSSIDHLLERLGRHTTFVGELIDGGLATLAGVSTELRSKAAAEKLAQAARGWMKVSTDEPIVDFADCAARAGALVFSIDLGPDAPEAASLVAGDLGIAVVNGHLKVGRRRLAAAHELGHLFTRDGYHVDWRIDAPDQAAWETRLDQFARALLLPEKPMRDLWSKRYDGGLREAAIRIASKYQVDMATLARRLTDLRLVTTPQADQIRVLRTGKAEIINFDLHVRDDLAAPAAPKLYQRAVLSLYDSDDITADRAVDLLVGTVSEAELPPRWPIAERDAWTLM